MSEENNDRLRKIFVGSLAWKTTTDDLRRYFQRFGEVVHANVVCESYPPRRSKGFGFVTFKDAESAAKAIKNPNPIIDGRTTYCKLAANGAKSNKNQPNQNVSSNHASTSQQYPSVVWNPISGRYNYMYYSPVNAYATYMMYYQDWINMTQQNHDNIHQENNEVVDNADVITIVDSDLDELSDG